MTVLQQIEALRREQVRDEYVNSLTRLVLGDDDALEIQAFREALFLLYIKPGGLRLFRVLNEALNEIAA